HWSSTHPSHPAVLNHAATAYELAGARREGLAEDAAAHDRLHIPDAVDHPARAGRSAGFQLFQERPVSRMRSGQRGQSTVEFGISAVVLIFILFGLIDLGRAFYFGVGLQGAAREGARAGTWFDAST